mmetsp:Transcript_87153/g.261871  ORF Transcript_87153/g.261871 Transcript_87153/m.261871 type:complete len:100 (+) Transcript_87153:78-377(+)
MGGDEGDGHIGSGGSEGGYGGGNGWCRAPQSAQSDPDRQAAYSEPAPPSSQSPSLACVQSLLHDAGSHGGRGGGPGGEGLDGGGGTDGGGTDGARGGVS